MDGDVGLKPDTGVLVGRLRGPGGGAHRLEEEKEDEYSAGLAGKASDNWISLRGF